MNGLRKFCSNWRAHCVLAPVMVALLVFQIAAGSVAMDEPEPETTVESTKGVSIIVETSNPDTQNGETPNNLMPSSDNAADVPSPESTTDPQSAPPGQSEQPAEPAVNPYHQMIDALSAKASILSDTDLDGKQSLAGECEQTAENLTQYAAFVEAKQCYDLAYELRRQAVGETDYSVMACLAGRAKCNWSLELHDDAIADYQQALAIVDAQPQVEGDNCAIQESILRGLVSCYLFLQKPDEAMLYGKRAHQLAITAFGATSLQSLWSAAQLSETMRVAGMAEQAVVFNHEMFDICLTRAGGREVAFNRSGSDRVDAQLQVNEPLPIHFWPCAGGKPKAILLCIHGMCLHSGSYQSFAECMSKKGFLVVALDVRGLGSWMQSSGQEYLNLSACLSDISSLSGELKTLCPDLPIFLIGESMGGGIVLQAAAQGQSHLAGVISCVPGAQRFKRGKETLRVALQMTRGLDSYMDVSKSLLKQATTNPSLRRDWLNDPLAKRYLSPRELIAFQSFMAANAKKARAIRNVPVLVLHGMRDGLVKPESTEEVFNAIRSSDKTLMKLDDREHLILELSQFTPEILERLNKWIEQHLQSVALLAS